MVTSYAEGGNLLKYCVAKQESQGWISETTARHIFLQLAQGLRDMHRIGLVHRDIKLLNVFMTHLSTLPRVKIGDLGLSVKLEAGEYVTR